MFSSRKASSTRPTNLPPPASSVVTPLRPATPSPTASPAVQVAPVVTHVAPPAPVAVATPPVNSERGSGSAWSIGDLKHTILTTDVPGWLVCDGRVLNTADYPLLSKAIGCAFGGSAQDGTFALPDARGQVIAASNAENETERPALSVGSKTIALTNRELPAHSHQVTLGAAGGHAHRVAYKSTKSSSSGNGSAPKLVDADVLQVDPEEYSSATTEWTSNHNHDVTVQLTGQGASFSLMQPTLYVGSLQIRCDDI